MVKRNSVSRSRRKFLRKLTQFFLSQTKQSLKHLHGFLAPNISRLNILCANTLTEQRAHDLGSFAVSLFRINSEKRTISDSLLYILYNGSVHLVSSAHARSISPQTDLHSASERHSNVGACFHTFLPKPGAKRLKAVLLI
jgi:hypothetical protein